MRTHIHTLTQTDLLQPTRAKQRRAKPEPHHVRPAWLGWVSFESAATSFCPSSLSSWPLFFLDAVGGRKSHYTREEDKKVPWRATLSAHAPLQHDRHTHTHAHPPLTRSLPPESAHWCSRTMGIANASPRALCPPFCCLRPSHRGSLCARWPAGHGTQRLAADVAGGACFFGFWFPFFCACEYPPQRRMYFKRIVGISMSSMWARPSLRSFAIPANSLLGRRSALNTTLPCSYFCDCERV